MKPYTFFLTAGSGVVASLASAVGKTVFTHLDIATTPWYVWVIGVCWILLVNSCMWTMLVGALRRCEQTAVVLAVNSACNLLSSAVFGQFFFGESLTYLWGLGATFLIAGISILQTAQSNI